MAPPTLVNAPLTWWSSLASPIVSKCAAAFQQRPSLQREEWNAYLRLHRFPRAEARSLIPTHLYDIRGHWGIKIKVPLTVGAEAARELPARKDLEVPAEKFPQVRVSWPRQPPSNSVSGKRPVARRPRRDG